MQKSYLIYKERSKKVFKSPEFKSPEFKSPESKTFEKERKATILEAVEILETAVRNPDTIGKDSTDQASVINNLAEDAAVADAAVAHVNELIGRATTRFVAPHIDEESMN